MNLSMKQNVALGLVVVFGLTLGQAQEIPDRPAPAVTASRDD